MLQTTWPVFSMCMVDTVRTQPRWSQEIFFPRWTQIYQTASGRSIHSPSAKTIVEEVQKLLYFQYLSNFFSQLSCCCWWSSSHLCISNCSSHFQCFSCCTGIVRCWNCRSWWQHAGSINVSWTLLLQDTDWWLLLAADHKWKNSVPEILLILCDFFLFSPFYYKLTTNDDQSVISCLCA